MFAGGITTLSSSAFDAGIVNVPRPDDALLQQYAEKVRDAVSRKHDYFSACRRLRDPDAYLREQKERRRDLEALLWTDVSQLVLDSMIDLIDLIGSESSWGVCDDTFDDASHPVIDLQAAETGVLFAWILRKHGVRLNESDPLIPHHMITMIRQRLLSPLMAHDDYDFMQFRGQCPALIMTDLLFCCLIAEGTAARRHPVVRRLMHLLDKYLAREQSPFLPYSEKLAEVCALADTARLLKRMTRGQLDLTGSVPSPAALEDLLIPWIARDYFVDPAGIRCSGTISGMDLFRLGYMNRNNALCSLGAELERIHETAPFGLTGRILSTEYRQACRDEIAAPPRLRRAVSESGDLMLSRMDDITAAIVCGGGISNAGDITLFTGNTPVLIDTGSSIHSVPAVNGHAPLRQPKVVPAAQTGFEKTRDMMSVDLTGAYPADSGIAAYQRTLILYRNDHTISLVDAFEFSQPSTTITFRFLCAEKPVLLRGSALLGRITMTWDSELQGTVTETDDGAFLLALTMRGAPHRTICGFTLEHN